MTEYKYKIGEKVRVRSDLDLAERYAMAYDENETNCVNKDMLKLRGKVVTIIDYYLDQYVIAEDLKLFGIRYHWTDEMFEEPKRKPIIIYQKDNQVIALDKNTGEKATATCCSEDHFDFYAGANLAYDRLKKQLKEKKSHAFNLGDYVIGTDDNPYAFTRKGWIGKVVELENKNCDIHVQRLSGGTKFPVEPQYFRLATDEDLTVECLKKSEE